MKDEWLVLHEPGNRGLGVTEDKMETVLEPGKRCC